MKSTRLKNGTFRFTMTDSEYSKLQSEDPGFCIQCGGETFGIEPDARCYECEECGERSA